MSDAEIPMSEPDHWNEFMDAMNESFAQALEQNVEAQSQFVESWVESLERATEEEQVKEGVEGYAKAYETWMSAAQESFERSGDAMAGEDVSPEEFRDIWLSAANEAFKDVTATSAFAAATGQSVEQALDLQQQADEAAEETLHTLGFATRGDVLEVGERLLEVERRQHAIEKKLDQLLEDR
ncbi:poly(R)-hydroxyalkanoic acid synthase subunit PhaE [Natronorarus salvus]|uniref:poly(R)-hydroxyalkanoic acid synthase subunit PhaE n=1 Tax=Natronorarus salvus TaxID=3117733 RepID=UPI0039083BE3